MLYSVGWNGKDDGGVAGKGGWGGRLGLAIVAELTWPSAIVLVVVLVIVIEFADGREGPIRRTRTRTKVPFERIKR